VGRQKGVEKSVCINSGNWLVGGLASSEPKTEKKLEWN
jgi:hypothetical protein